MKNYSPYQFSFFRIILGTYLVIHFAMLLPYASEIWSSMGLLPNAALNLTHGFFPNILNLFDSSFAVTALVAFLLLCAILFLLGIQRPFVSLLLWYGWVCLFDRNNLISNPGLPFIGWILLCCAVIPVGEPLTLLASKKEDWEFPRWLFLGAWTIMSISYTLSGIDKLNSPSWWDGNAIVHLLHNPLARDWGLRTFFLALPTGILQVMTWGILLIEVSFLPLALWNKTRPWIWLAMIGMHLGILLIVDFADLTMGMLMIHWFTFDASWLKPSRTSATKNIVFFDGVCGLCNAFIDFLLKEDKEDVLLFSPLQGETAQQYIKGIDASNLTTVVFYTEDKAYTKSDAVIEIFKSIGGIWRLVVVFKVIPKPLRDAAYGFVAAHRIQWFGQKESCRMPTSKERGKLLR